ncbi:LLM class flavin-dependent oxidoreductase [Nakamurella sp. UYEF19]|uniref:LLM class flavin-dependent oxidoreductase n=1 Tax=Nakamurella sp. UYEF19 TaxID=1756392 RepID=UPI003392C7BF
MFDRDRAPEALPGFAAELEAAGVDEIWVVEDLGFGGGISAAATALAATTGIRVGIGIVPAPFRNPALLAMEIATLERLHPGRLIAGIGHGVGPWMVQVGASVASTLTLLEETMVGVRALLSGARVRTTGRYITIDDVQLVHPPAAVPPLMAGVMKPRSLRLSGRIADGTILAEGTGPATVTAALADIDATPAHQLVVLTHLCVSDDPAAVEAATAPVRAEFAAVQGIAPEDVFLAAGPAGVVAARIRSLWDAGSDSVVLRPVGGDPLRMVQETLAAVGR